jgi:multidrug efflux pump subunit AcrA (membrane-fusion protein)
VTRWIVVAVLLAGCGGRDQPRDSAAAQADTSPEGAATPVRTAAIQLATLAITVRAPGHTEVLRPLHVRAPFNGTVATLRVADGDRVLRGATLGTLVSRSSAAALAGARAMLDAARTEAERQDAQRAIDLATRGLVQFPLHASEAGVVVSHAANGGDLVTEGDDILVIAPAGAVAFIAQVVQTDLPRLRPGQRVAVDLAARSDPLAGTVHGVLPAASVENLSAPVRIDFVTGGGPIGTGLFGTARIVVGERRQVPVVPEAALLQDDVYGTTQVAIVGPAPDRRAHWVRVTPGVREGGLVEILSPSLPPGTIVIVSGQVGLPEGAPVRAQP